jgi:hypothetical protein
MKCELTMTIARCPRCEHLHWRWSCGSQRMVCARCGALGPVTKAPEKKPAEAGYRVEGE